MSTTLYNKGLERQEENSPSKSAKILNRSSNTRDKSYTIHIHTPKDTKNSFLTRSLPPHPPNRDIAPDAALEVEAVVLPLLVGVPRELVVVIFPVPVTTELAVIEGIKVPNGTEEVTPASVAPTPVEFLQLEGIAAASPATKTIAAHFLYICIC